MIFHDRVIVALVPRPAEVRPMTTADSARPGDTQTITRFRVFMGPAMETIIGSTSQVTWRGKDWEIEGEVEPHMNHGRVHHVEFTIKRVVG